MILSVRNLAAAINNTDYIVNYVCFHDKYIVYVYIDGVKKYVRYYRDYKYVFVRDPLYAAKYTEKKAIEHLNRLSDMIKHNEL